MRRILVPAILAAATLAGPATHAALELQLNPSTREFALFGQDTGTLQDFGALGGGVFWKQTYGDLAGSPTEQVSIYVTGLFTTTTGQPGWTLDGRTVEIDTNISGSITIGLLTSLYSPDPTTLAGTGVFTTYDFSPAFVAFLEGMVGRTVALDTGAGAGGFDPLAVTAIPEPAGLALSAVAVLALLRLNRPRRRGTR